MPDGAAYKRIDYAWVRGITVTASDLFGVVPTDTPAPSNHYGLVTSLAVPAADAPVVTVPLIWQSDITRQALQ